MAGNAFEGAWRVCKGAGRACKKARRTLEKVASVSEQAGRIYDEAGRIFEAWIASMLLDIANVFICDGLCIKPPLKRLSPPQFYPSS